MKGTERLSLTVVSAPGSFLVPTAVSEVCFAEFPTFGFPCASLLGAIH